MNLYALDAEIAQLEAELATQGADRRLPSLVALAWNLRQRDSRRALELCDEVGQLGPDEASRTRVCMVRAEVAALMAEFPQAEREIAEALSVCSNLGDACLEGDAAMVEAVVAHSQAQRERYMGAWERAVELYARADDPLRRNLARAWLAFLGTHSDRVAAAADVAALRAAVPEPRHAALEALLCAAEGMLTFADAQAGSSVAAHKASLHARECGLVRHAIVSSVNAATAMQTLGDIDGAAEAYRWAVEEARKTAWPVVIGTTIMRLASLHRELNQLESSEQLYREGLQALAPAPGGVFKAEAHSGLGNTLLRQGRPAEAVELFKTAVELFMGENSIDGLTVTLTMLTRAYAQCRRGAEAEITLGRARGLVEIHNLVRLRVDLNEAQAELYECEAIPAPPGMTSMQAALKYLEASLAAGQALEGWQPPSRLLLRLGRTCAALGDAQRAFCFAEQAFQTQQRENLRRATSAAAVMNARHEMERDRAELAHQRDLVRVLEEASLTDALTGLRNRRFLQQHLEHDVAQSLRSYRDSRGELVDDADLLFFLVDLDHFKHVNDTYGHAAGDAVLVQMRERLTEVFRESDYLIRWGGEEFLIVVRGFPRAGAAQLAERVRATVAGRPFPIEGRLELQKSCSLGFAAFPFLPRHPYATSWQEVVDIADAGLYLAKRNGRNGWVGLTAIASSEPTGYAQRIKDDASAMIGRGDLACDSSLEALRERDAIRA